MSEDKDKTLELPEWTDCQSAFADGTATPLTEFIRAYEPVDPEREQWRIEFASALATVRREAREETWRQARILACRRIGVATNGNESWLTTEKVEFLCDDIRDSFKIALERAADSREGEG